MDRPLLVAFSTSLTCHAVFLGVQLVHVTRQIHELDSKPLKVIYEFQAAEQEMKRLQRQVAQLESGGSSGLPGLSSPTPTIRIPDRATLTLPTPSGIGEVNRETIVDLTNLVEAAQGDPILLSYFSAIREKIQSTANKQTWMAGEQSQGLVYISFVLSDTGQVQSPQILTDRSESSRFLQEIALKIIRGSNPFPPFPPSLKESSRTVVVPLEFLLGSQTG
jgi:TonB family protein